MDLKDLKTTELRAKSLDELNDILAEVTGEYAEMKFQATTGQVENTSKIRLLRRSIARVNTLIPETETVDRSQLGMDGKYNHVEKNASRSRCQQ